MADKAPAWKLVQRSGLEGFVRAALALVPEPGLGILRVQLRGQDGAELLARALGAPVPSPRTQSKVSDATLAWYAPGEWLLIGAEASMSTLRDALEQSLSEAVVLVTDLSHAAASFRLTGSGAVDALAGNCPLDLRDRAFPADSVARSCLGDTGLFIARLADVDGAPAFRLIVDQTMSAYAVRMLAGARAAIHGESA
jgi:sarcosine oxidase subunit gamma